MKGITATGNIGMQGSTSAPAPSFSIVYATAFSNDGLNSTESISLSQVGAEPTDLVIIGQGAFGIPDIGWNTITDSTVAPYTYKYRIATSSASGTTLTIPTYQYFNQAVIIVRGATGVQSVAGFEAAGIETSGPVYIPLTFTVPNDGFSYRAVLFCDDRSAGLPTTVDTSTAVWSSVTSMFFTKTYGVTNILPPGSNTITVTRGGFSSSSYTTYVIGALVKS